MCTKIWRTACDIKKIVQKGGKSLLTTAVGYGTGKLIEPLVVVVSKSGVWFKITDVVKGGFGSKISKKDIEYLKENNIKFSEKDLISTVRASDGKVVCLERGTEKQVYYMF